MSGTSVTDINPLNGLNSKNMTNQNSNVIRLFPDIQDESVESPEEVQYVYEAREFSRNITPPSLNIKKGYKAIVKIKQEPLETTNTAFFVENESFANTIAYRIIELEENLKKAKQDNNSILQELLKLQGRLDSIDEKEGKGMTYHNKLIKKRKRFEKFTFIFGLAMSLFLILLPVISGLNFAVIFPSLVIFLSLPIFVKFRRKLRGDNYEH